MNPADRYQICDPICGLVYAVGTLTEALDGAEQHARGGCTGVEVFDCMAHYGAPQAWNSAGTVLQVRALTRKEKIR